ncbi:MAG: hypothetical protein KC619_35815, partial [Myxococcales bacterium]|nr:hypothetical protein [Myxococcales bacterium]
PDPPPDAPRAALDPPDVAPEPAVAAAPSPDARVFASALFAVDLVPGPAAGVAVSTDAWIVDPVRWRLGFVYFPEATTGGDDASFGFGLTAATLDVCVRAFTAGPVVGTGCLGGAAGAIHAVVYDPVPAAPGDYAWGALRASLEVAVEIEDRFTLALAATGAVPFARWAFRVTGREGVEFQQPWVIPGGRLSAGVRFW